MQVRISKGKLASGSIVPRPEILKQRRNPLPFKGTVYSFVQRRLSQKTSCAAMLDTMHTFPASAVTASRALAMPEFSWVPALLLAGSKDSENADALEVTYKPGDWPSALPVPDASTPLPMDRTAFQLARHQQRLKTGVFFRGFSAAALA